MNLIFVSQPRLIVLSIGLALFSALYPSNLHASDAGSEFLQAYKRSDYSTVAKLLEEGIKRSEENPPGDVKSSARNLYSDYLTLAYVQTWKLGKIDAGAVSYQKAAGLRTSMGGMKEYPPVEQVYLAAIDEQKGDLPGARARYQDFLDALTKQQTDAADKLSGMLSDDLSGFIKYQIDGLLIKEHRKDFKRQMPAFTLSSITGRLAASQFLIMLFVPHMDVELLTAATHGAADHVGQTAANPGNMFLDLFLIINASAGSVTEDSEAAMKAYLLKYPDSYWSFFLGGALYKFYQQNGENKKADALLTTLRSRAEARGMTLVNVVPDTRFSSSEKTPAYPLGPYTGTVVDGVTGRPVEGASVLFYWTREIPQMIESRTETIAVRLTYTDHQGRYDIPRVSANLGLMGRLDSTNVIIYQPGYKAYIIRLFHNDPYAREEPRFKETGNRVALERIPPGFSHQKQVDAIEQALWGIDEYWYYYPQPPDDISWDRMMAIKMNGSVEKRELLRRLEWEERRGKEEGTR
jgi:hypothetical protein